VDSPGGRIIYSPHSRAGYRLAPSKLLYRIAVGGLTRRGLQQAHASGFLTG
jgi:hypothetical protein